MKKPLALILCLALLASLGSIFAVTVSAAGPMVVWNFDAPNSARALTQDTALLMDAVVARFQVGDGGSYKGKRRGTICDAGAYSFNYFKIISAGEGGAVLTNDDTYYERALIYHDTGTAYRPYAEAMSEPFFSSYNMRTNEIAAAVLREQLKRLDGILEDLRRVRKEITAGIKLNDGVHFTPFNDAEGDCGTLLGLVFDDADRAAAFATEVGALCLINSKKHIYINWDPMLNRLGGHTDAMNPYLDPANADLNKEINPDTCPVTLDILRRSVNISMNPDWTAEEIAEKIAKINAALGA